MHLPEDTRQRVAEQLALAALARTAKSEGLLRPAPSWYAVRISVTLLAWLACVVALWALAGHPYAAAWAVGALALVQGQFGLLAHDAGHGHMAVSRAWNRGLGLLLGNALLGLSFAWWCDKHDRHHSHPNQLGHDPDLEVWFQAYSPKQYLAASPLRRAVLRWQGLLLPCLLPFESLSLKVDSLLFLVREKRAPLRFVEAALLACHHVLHLLLLSVLFGVSAGCVLYLLNQGVLGIYLCSMFLPNHIGRPIVEQADLSRLRHQVTTARDLIPHPLTKLLFGPLVFQIEHHVFPRVPLPRLQRIKQLLEQCCRELGVPYHETGIFTAYREATVALRDVVSSARGENTSRHPDAATQTVTNRIDQLPRCASVADEVTVGEPG